jgi:hypothetical protein
MPPTPSTGPSDVPSMEKIRMDLESRIDDLPEEKAERMRTLLGKYDHLLERLIHHYRSLIDRERAMPDVPLPDMSGLPEKEVEELLSLMAEIGYCVIEDAPIDYTGTALSDIGDKSFDTEVNDAAEKLNEIREAILNRRDREKNFQPTTRELETIIQKIIPAFRNALARGIPKDTTPEDRKKTEASLQHLLRTATAILHMDIVHTNGVMRKIAEKPGLLVKPGGGVLVIALGVLTGIMMIRVGGKLIKRQKPEGKEVAFLGGFAAALAKSANLLPEGKKSESEKTSYALMHMGFIPPPPSEMARGSDHPFRVALEQIGGVDSLLETLPALSELLEDRNVRDSLRDILKKRSISVDQIKMLAEDPDEKTPLVQKLIQKELNNEDRFALLSVLYELRIWEEDELAIVQNALLAGEKNAKTFGG